MMEVRDHIKPPKRKFMSIITVGVDLAKNVFAVHGVDDSGKAALVKPKVPREQLLPLIAQLPPCLIGREACSGAHHWARRFRQFGHTVRLMAPEFVTPYRMSGKRGKNDAADAAAICEAVGRPAMRLARKVPASNISCLSTNVRPCPFVLPSPAGDRPRNELAKVM
jgi:transposase